MKIAIVLLVFWRMSQEPEAVASSCASASCYRCSKDIIVEAVIIFELTFRNVKRHVFGADLVERADNRPLKDRPEALNRVRVYCADNVFAGAMHDGLMWIVAKVRITRMFVGCEQADFGRNSFANESFQVSLRDELQDTRHHVALTAYSADDWRLKRPADAFAALALMPIALFAADVGLINLNDAHELLKFLVLQSGADAVANVPSCFVGAEAHMAFDLQSTDAFLRAKHQVNNLEPVEEIDLGILKNGADKVREAISTALTAIWALPLKFHGGERIDVCRATARAMNALRPAAADKVIVASLFVRKEPVEIPRGQLLYLLSHNASPMLGRD
jgi:hypothetical protein